jgi:uncharacterized protein
MTSRSKSSAFETVGAVHNAAIGPDKATFIPGPAQFLHGTVSETGWPCVQHRGGSPGFVKVVDQVVDQVVDPDTLSFMCLPGNRQFIGVGNLAHNDRVALVLVTTRIGSA